MFGGCEQTVTNGARQQNENRHGKGRSLSPQRLYYDICELIVVYSAVANSVHLENLLEEKKDFEEEVCNAFFVAITRAIL